MQDSSFTRIAEGVQRGEQFTIEVDGTPVVAFAGETIATALLASGRRSLRHTEKHEKPRGIFCGIGICFDCLMTVNGLPNVRTCVTPVRDGMAVETQDGRGGWGRPRGDSSGSRPSGVSPEEWVRGAGAWAPPEAGA